MRNERPIEEERPPSMAAGELVQLRQRHTVSGIRYDFFIAFWFKIIVFVYYHCYIQDVFYISLVAYIFLECLEKDLVYT